MSSAEAPSEVFLPEALAKALMGERIPHAILLAGTKGSGQSEAARHLARFFLCEKRFAGKSCGQCIHCQQVDRLVHPDLTVLTPPDDSPGIKVEPVRDLIAKANLRPFTAQSKVFVIEPAESMNEIAQNALLKTLEEPEGSSYFILVSYAPNELLVTIRSRVQTFHFFPLPSTGDWDEDLLPYGEEVMQYLFPGSIERKVPDLSGLERQEVVRVLDGSIRFLRDVLLAREGGEEILKNMDNRYLKEKYSKVYSSDVLMEKIELLAEFKEKFQNNVNLKLGLSVLWKSII